MDKTEYYFEFLYDGDFYGVKVHVTDKYFDVIDIVDANQKVPDNIPVELINYINQMGQSLLMEHIADFPSDDNIH